MNGSHALVALTLVAAATLVACAAGRKMADGDAQAAPAPLASEPSSQPTTALTTEAALDPAPVAAPEPAPDVVDALNAFGAALFARAAAEEGNVLLSPVSVAGALHMTLAGAAGDTRAEMQAALRVPDAGPQFHAAAGALQRALAAEGAATVDIANRIWVERTWEPRVRDDFRATIGTAYSGGFELVDFANASEQARHEINAWVADRTREKIPELVPMGALTALTRFVLTNAVYFHADWFEAFDPDQTVDAPFHAPGGDVTAALMHRRARMRHAESGDWQAVALPYRDLEWDMIVVLPTEGRAAAFERDAAASLAEATEGMEQVDVDLTFPKFRFRWSGSLVATLKALGMERAFDERADFSALADLQGTDGLYVSDVLHEAFVEVDEVGTEAAAATAVIVATRAAPIEPRVVEMRVDRPFYFALRHADTGALLFLGRVEDPTAE